MKATLVHKPENIRYETGFIGSFGLLLITDNQEKHLITDGRYELKASEICTPDTNITIIKENLNQTLGQLLAKLKIKTISFDGNFLPYSQVLLLRKTFSEIKFEAKPDKIIKSRMQKTATEIELIKKAQIINEQTLKAIINHHLKINCTEREIALKIERIGQDLGAEKCSFPPIVAFGKNSASPHHSPGNQKLKQGDTVLIDMGFIYQGYMSDMTRTFFTKKPTNQQIAIYNLVLKAQTEAIKSIKINQKCSDIDKLTREIITNEGYGEQFSHSSGHGIGLEIHEPPSFSQKSKHLGNNIKLQENMIMTIEPGIYLPEEFGVRIEDMIQITKEGNHNLTTFPKELSDAVIEL